jgi:hypothetical protein
MTELPVPVTIKIAYNPLRDNRLCIIVAFLSPNLWCVKGKVKPAIFDYSINPCYYVRSLAKACTDASTSVPTARTFVSSSI